MGMMISIQRAADEKEEVKEEKEQTTKFCLAQIFKLAFGG